MYRESATGVGQKCITPEEGQIILDDIHSGTCGHHASSRTIVAKAYRAGFYWPRANEMAKEIVDKCDDAVRNSISKYQLSDETDSSASIKILDRLGFNPFGELVDCYQHMSEAAPAPKQRRARRVQWYSGLTRACATYWSNTDILHICRLSLSPFHSLLASRIPLGML